MKKLHPKLARALKTLRDVEGRDWFAILLDSANPIDVGGEAVKLIKVAVAYKRFVVENPDTTIGAKKEAYGILQIAFNGGHFPVRRYLNKAQFGRLLDLHLELEAT